MGTYSGTSASEVFNITGQNDYIGSWGNDTIYLTGPFDTVFDYTSFSVDLNVSLQPSQSIVNKGGIEADIVYVSGDVSDSYIRLDLGSGNDTVVQNLGNYAYIYYELGQGNDRLEVQSGGARVEYHRTATTGITYTSDDGARVSGTVTGGGIGTDTLINVEAIRGTDFADIFNGGNGDEVFLPRGGNDTINGGGGNDLVRYNRSGIDAGALLLTWQLGL